MNKPIYVLNGANLNRLGTREPEIYGTTTLKEIEQMCRKAAGSTPIEFRQTNAEHELIGWIHEAIDQAAGIVIVDGLGLPACGVEPVVARGDAAVGGNRGQSRVSRRTGGGNRGQSQVSRRTARGNRGGNRGQSQVSRRTIVI